MGSGREGYENYYIGYQWIEGYQVDLYGITNKCVLHTKYSDLKDAKLGCAGFYQTRKLAEIAYKTLLKDEIKFIKGHIQYQQNELKELEKKLRKLK